MRIILLLSFLLSGCSFYVGTAMHLTKQDQPEIYAPNPIGIVGGAYRKDGYLLFCEHQSSIPYYESGYGLNECGIKIDIYSAN